MGRSKKKVRGYADGGLPPLPETPLMVDQTAPPGGNLAGSNMPSMTRQAPSPPAQTASQSGVTGPEAPSMGEAMKEYFSGNVGGEGYRMGRNAMMTARSNQDLARSRAHNMAMRHPMGRNRRVAMSAIPRMFNEPKMPTFPGGTQPRKSAQPKAPSSTGYTTPYMGTGRYAYADGGPVFDATEGGVVPPGPPGVDTVPAMMSTGPAMLDSQPGGGNQEYVLPADTTAQIGVENLDALKDATHDAQQTQERRYADGGVVPMDEAQRRADSIVERMMRQSRRELDAEPPAPPPQKAKQSADEMVKGIRNEAGKSRGMFKRMFGLADGGVAYDDWEEIHPGDMPGKVQERRQRAVYGQTGEGVPTVGDLEMANRPAPNTRFEGDSPHPSNVPKQLPSQGRGVRPWETWRTATGNEMDKYGPDNPPWDKRTLQANAAVDSTGSSAEGQIPLLENLPRIPEQRYQGVPAFASDAPPVQATDRAAALRGRLTGSGVSEAEAAKIAGERFAPDLAVQTQMHEDTWEPPAETKPGRIERPIPWQDVTAQERAAAGARRQGPKSAGSPRTGYDEFTGQPTAESRQSGGRPNLTLGLAKPPADAPSGYPKETSAADAAPTGRRIPWQDEVAEGRSSEKPTPAPPAVAKKPPAPADNASRPPMPRQAQEKQETPWGGIGGNIDKFREWRKTVDRKIGAAFAPAVSPEEEKEILSLKPPTPTSEKNAKEKAVDTREASTKPTGNLTQSPQEAGLADRGAPVRASSTNRLLPTPDWDTSREWGMEEQRGHVAENVARMKPGVNEYTIGGTPIYGTVGADGAPILGSTPAMSTEAGLDLLPAKGGMPQDFYGGRPVSHLTPGEFEVFKKQYGNEVADMEAAAKWRSLPTNAPVGPGEWSGDRRGRMTPDVARGISEGPKTTDRMISAAQQRQASAIGAQADREVDVEKIRIPAQAGILEKEIEGRNALALEQAKNPTMNEGLLNEVKESEVAAMQAEEAWEKNKNDAKTTRMLEAARLRRKAARDKMARALQNSIGLWTARKQEGI